jgi:hypothetical protein
MLKNFALRPMAIGALTWMPGLQRAFAPVAGASSRSADYCYGVWLKHLALLHASGMRGVPAAVEEFGPGESLGTGVAALLSGARRYVGVDAVRHANAERTGALLDGLVELFRLRAPRPARGWPDYDALLDERLFPGSILTEELLAASLVPERVGAVRRAVARLDGPSQDAALRYGTWCDFDPARCGPVDLVFSHVVLGQVEDPGEIYAHCARVLGSGGWMSHQIDLSSHGVTRRWNGHLAFDDAAWKLITGRRAYFVNRERLGGHLELMRLHGFEPVTVLRNHRIDGIPRSKLAARWKALSEDDLNCAGAFVVARKR